MKFIEQINYTKGIKPVRAYIHETGFKEGYNNQIDLATKFLLENLFPKKNYKLPQEFNSMEYFITGIWADPSNGNRFIDVFGYSDIKNNWSGNPDANNWTINKFGVWLPYMKACGDMMKILGLEEMYRGATKNLSDYINNPPPLEKMNKLSLDIGKQLSSPSAKK